MKKIDTWLDIQRFVSAVRDTQVVALPEERIEIIARPKRRRSKRFTTLFNKSRSV